MKNIAEWMATEADNKERRDFKKVHELLSIETDPSGHQTQPVEYGPPVEQQIGLEEQDNDNVDIALENLNAGLNGITMQCWRDNLRTTYQDTFTHGAETMKPKEDMLRTKEKVWQLIGNIVNDDAIDYVSHRIAGLGSGDADLVWDTLQKLAANEEVLRDTKETDRKSVV